MISPSHVMFGFSLFCYDIVLLVHVVAVFALFKSTY